MVGDQTLPRFFRQASWPWRLVALGWVGGFGGATYNHVSDLVRGGWLPYQAGRPEIPFALNLYWTSLTFLDPLAILILFWRVRWGTWAYLAVIATDVVVNASATLIFDGPQALWNFFFVCQAGFLVFVLATFTHLNRGGAAFHGA